VHFNWEGEKNGRSLAAAIPFKWGFCKVRLMDLGGRVAGGKPRQEVGGGNKVTMKLIVFSGFWKKDV